MKTPVVKALLLTLGLLILAAAPALFLLPQTDDQASADQAAIDATPALLAAN